jgi:hypothetical protein
LGGITAAMKRVMEMNKNKYVKQVLIAILILHLLVGCGTPDTSPT